MPLTVDDDVAEQEEVDVAVDEALVGARERDLLDRQFDGAVVADPVEGQIDIRPQPGRVRQEMTDRDVLLAVALEAGHVVRHAIVQPDAALLHEQHRARRRGDDLGERRRVEDRVERHRLARGLDGAGAERLPIQDAVAWPTSTTAPASLPSLMACSTSAPTRAQFALEVWACADCGIVSHAPSMTTMTSAVRLSAVGARL